VSDEHYTVIMRCLLRRDYDSASLVRAHPPRLGHAHKRLVYDLCDGTATTGAVAVTRWDLAELPERVELAPTEIVAVRGYYDYAGSDAGTWHVNFADPRLFVAYGSPLLAQDELQAAEHPVLGSIREALLHECEAAVTEEAGRPTPVLVAGAERRCVLETGRPHDLYGNRFARASADAVRAAVRVLDPPTRTNLIAMAAPVGSGEYTRKQIDRIAATAFTGFRAACLETERLWPGAPTEVCTGFWGCGAFGGNRELMTLVQLLAARLAGVTRVRFYVFDDAGDRDFARGAAALDRVLAGDETLDAVLERIADLDYAWGASDGN
jgi:hypothetical protein